LLLVTPLIVLVLSRISKAIDGTIILRIAIVIPVRGQLLDAILRVLTIRLTVITNLITQAVHATHTINAGMLDGLLHQHHLALTTGFL
jgi:hypothetical protein